MDIKPFCLPKKLRGQNGFFRFPDRSSENAGKKLRYKQKSGENFLFWLEFVGMQQKMNAKTVQTVHEKKIDGSVLFLYNKAWDTFIKIQCF